MLYVQQWLADAPPHAAQLVKSAAVTSGALGAPAGHVELDLEFDGVAEFEQFRAAAPPPAFFRRGDRPILAEVRNEALHAHKSLQ